MGLTRGFQGGKGHDPRRDGWEGGESRKNECRSLYERVEGQNENVGLEGGLLTAPIYGIIA